MIRALLFQAVALVLAGCATSPQIFGPLSTDDIRAIKLLVAQRSDIRKPILRIDADHSGRARLQTGRDETPGDISQTFAVAKRSGKWCVVLPIKEDRLVITSRSG